MLKKIIMLFAILTMIKNINCAQDELNISPLSDAEFEALENYECSICWENMNIENLANNQDNRWPYRANCGQLVPHVFHRRCIIEIQDRRCPICRAQIARPSARDWFNFAIDGNIDGIQALIDNDIDIDRQSGSGRTALMYAAFEGFHNIVQLLINNNANLNIRDINGETALMRSIYNQDSYNITALLIDNHANVNIQDNRFGLTALMIACYTDDEDIARLLINNHADVNIQDFNETTALMIANNHGNENISSLLISQGAH